MPYTLVRRSSENILDVTKLEECLGNEAYRPHMRNCACVAESTGRWFPTFVIVVTEGNTPSLLGDMCNIFDIAASESAA